jgi:hypothetical protein
MRMSGRRVRLALPWLDRAALAGSPVAAERYPDTEWLLARARRSAGAAVARPSWRDWLLDGASVGPDLLRRFPAGPCLRAACTGERPSGSWACAAPVHLAAALDHLRLAAPAPLPLGIEETRALVSDLNQRLAGRGYTLHASERGWLCECPPGLDCEAPEPADALGGNLRESMPTGRDAARVNAWVSEVQMVLHEHPVNLRRESRGLPPVNSVWLWGFGEAGPAQARPGGALLTDDGWLAGLWRLHGEPALEPGGLAAVLAGDAAVIRIGLACDCAAGAASGSGAQDAAGALRALEQQVAGPLRAAFESGALERAAILCGAADWDVDARARWRFWRRPRPLGELLT